MDWMLTAKLGTASQEYSVTSIFEVRPVRPWEGKGFHFHRMTKFHEGYA
jgi:hypothetical protein